MLPGDWVLVLGAGAVGLGLIQLCRQAGGRVLAVGRSPRKLELARALGAEATIDAAHGSVVELVEEGRVRTVVDRVATFEEIGQALQDLAAGRILGRVVLRPSG